MKSAMKNTFLSLKTFLNHSFFDEQHRLLLWLPVFLSCGILIYFALPFEPQIMLSFSSCAITLFLSYAFRKNFHLMIFFISLFAITLGFLSSHMRTQTTKTPFLISPQEKVLIKGRVINVESMDQKTRITLDQLITTPHHNLEKVRLSLPQNISLKPGDKIQTGATLMRPNGPLLKDAYDFKRQAFYNQLSAVGYSKEFPNYLGYDDSFSLSLKIASWRHNLSNTIWDNMNDSSKGIGAALITGDRSKISKELSQAFIDSGLTHILSISGLHLSLVAGIIFTFVRRGLTFFPFIALNYPIKKIAAITALLSVTFYTLISGSDIPVVRSLFMTSLFMIAILIDRIALGIRSVFLAAFFMLLFMPEIIFSPSFQLSFAAVLGLVAFFEKNPHLDAQEYTHHHWSYKIARYFFAIFMTTMIATLITIPYTIYLFNRFTIYAVFSNMVAIPLTGILIMPAAISVVFFLPFKDIFLLKYLLKASLSVYQWSIEQLIIIANVVSKWPGASVSFSSMSLWVLFLMTLGILWLCIWQKRWRYLGILPISIGCLGLFLSAPPDLIVDQSGRYIGLIDKKTLWVNRKINSFMENVWQQKTITNETKIMDFKNPPLGFSCKHGVCQKDGIIINFSKKQTPCVSNALIITLKTKQTCSDPSITIIHSEYLRQHSSLVIWKEKKGYRIESSSLKTNRPWQ